MRAVLARLAEAVAPSSKNISSLSARNTRRTAVGAVPARLGSEFAISDKDLDPLW